MNLSPLAIATHGLLPASNGARIVAVQGFSGVDVSTKSTGGWFAYPLDRRKTRLDLEAEERERKAQEYAEELARLAAKPTSGQEQKPKRVGRLSIRTAELFGLAGSGSQPILIQAPFAISADEVLSEDEEIAVMLLMMEIG